MYQKIIKRRSSSFSHCWQNLLRLRQSQTRFFATFKVLRKSQFWLESVQTRCTALEHVSEKNNGEFSCSHFWQNLDIISSQILSYRYLKFFKNPDLNQLNNIRTVRKNFRIKNSVLAIFDKICLRLCTKVVKVHGLKPDFWQLEEY